MKPSYQLPDFICAIILVCQLGMFGAFLWVVTQAIWKGMGR